MTIWLFRHLFKSSPPLCYPSPLHRKFSIPTWRPFSDKNLNLNNQITRIIFKMARTSWMAGHWPSDRNSLENNNETLQINPEEQCFKMTRMILWSKYLQIINKNNKQSKWICIFRKLKNVWPNTPLASQSFPSTIWSRNEKNYWLKSKKSLH